ncbi:transcriptional repressor [Mumia sp. zg.B17]|uniref:Fur family transcriptional regulator n=1 Tax=unclassified Mumia TaxID=2621872 RepID=UPI001C6E97EF|nr:MULTISPECIES: Fur family transcriptional regulator [unclassified Mumia]MBW9207943.1 transcriptional repressor [Mumia sp. zg.B17]MBW9210791.1 transcriptional repressor [Mumia sp. zg.B21]MDD9350283.1 Fur family transcriptional regulator [Mumia sp.]
MPSTQVWDAAAALRKVGLRVTRQRLAVLDALRDRPHASADTLTTVTREALGSVSVQAVYDVLAACAEHGLVRRIQPAGSPALFEARTQDNHHHLVCVSCAKIADVDCVSGEAPCLIPDDAQGFAVSAAEVVFWGTCPDCATAAASPQ